MELPKVYGQRDPRWANEKLGFGRNTIGSHGCLITDISIMVDAFDYPKNQATPHDINWWLKQFGGYADKDLVVWSKVPKISASIFERGHAANPTEAQVSTFLMEGNTLAICEIRMNGYQHYVLAYKGSSTGVWCHDPWYNRQTHLRDFGKIYVAHLYGDKSLVQNKRV